VSRVHFALRRRGGERLAIIAVGHACEPELQEAVSKSPAMRDGPLTQSTLIAKIVFVFLLERIIPRFYVFAFDSCLEFSHFFAPFSV
jgi:hypothetical protein